MRYHIDTIPVWDALKLEGECLLCALQRKTELGEAERYLGASVMEPDTRVQVNDKGFCPHHHAMLFQMSNRLGHALMLESHMIETRKRTEKVYEKLENAAGTLKGIGLAGRLGGKAKGADAAVRESVEELRKITDSCLMCETIEANMQRYLHTFLHLYQHDTDFRNRFSAGKGLCLPHTARLLEAAQEELGPKDLGELISVLTKLQRENMDRMQEDISWFIKKFDYRYEKESWGNSKDAVERTVNKLRGWCVGKEPNPEESRPAALDRPAERTGRMTIREVMKIVDGKILVGEEWLDAPVDTACGSDLMSDVLAFVKEKTVLITGLINPHVVRTSEMLDITCIVFSRGKMPSEEILEMAEEVGIAVISSPLTTYTACGELYLHGLPGTKPKKPAPEGA